MKRKKLTLNTQTILTLTPAQLGRAGGGVGSKLGYMCSTWEDTGCQPSGNYLCDTSGGGTTCACGTQQTCASQIAC